MRAAFKRVIGKVAEIGEKLILQVTVSVAATVCVATITNTYMSGGTAEVASAPQELSSAEPHLVASLLKAHFTEDGFRSRVASTDEFAAVFGPSADLFFSPPAAHEWSVETADLTPEAPAHSKARQIIASACTDECGHLPVSGILPPVRPAVAQTVEMAQATVPSVDVSEKRPLQLLGVSLPNLVPSPTRVVSAVTSWGESVANLVLR